jgi:hypothetical protein
MAITVASQTGEKSALKNSVVLTTRTVVVMMTDSTTDISN